MLAVLSLGTASLAWSACGRSPAAGQARSDATLAPLLRALGGRPFEPRLTGSSYASCRSRQEPEDIVPDAVCGSRANAAPHRSRELVEAARQIQAALGSLSDPVALHVRSVVRLAEGGPPHKLDEVVASLERASLVAPGNAAIQSDLAAALFIRAQTLDQPEDLITALDVIGRALAVDGSRLEALFNRAVILETLGLDFAARSAWNEYQRRDPGSPWAAEAQDRLRRLAVAPDDWEQARDSLAPAVARGDLRSLRETVGRFRQTSREYGEEELLGAWAEARDHGDGEAAGAILAVAQALATALAGLGGDRLLLDAMSVIGDAQAAGDTLRLSYLTRGHRAYREGLALYQKNAGVSAEHRLAEARAALTRARSPFAARAALYQASFAYTQGRYSDALAELRHLERDLGDRRYPALRGHIAWLRGVSHAVQGAPVEAIEQYETAIVRFQDIGEAGNANAAHGLLARSLDQIGQRREAWRHRYLGFRGHRGLRTPRARILALVGAADACLEQGKQRPALLFQDEVVRQAGLHASRENDVLHLVDSLLWRGLMRSRAGLRREADEDLRHARSLIARLPPVHARRMETDITMMEGLAAFSEEPALSASLLTSALDSYESRQNRLLALLVRQARARAFRRAGDLEAAEHDLQTAVAAYETLGTSPLPERTRLTIFEKADGVFDELIALQAIDRGQPAAAFATVDRARTRVLPGRLTQADVPAGVRRQLGAAEPSPLGWAEISARLPERTLLVQYAVLADRLLIWWFRRGATEPRFAERQVSREELRKLGSRVGRLPRDGAPSARWADASTALFDHLVRPWSADLAPGETVAIVSDDILDRVPFACLLDRRSGRYLVQDVQLVRAPSATLYVSAPVARRGARPRSALVMGNPAFDHHLFDLPDLPAAADEAARVAAMLPGAQLRSGKDAGKSAFFALAPQSDVLHFAGHAEVNPRSPLHSHLLLAPSAGDPGPLYAWEIYGLDLTATDLVVLSACGTGALPEGSGEGVTSLAQAFLAAGAPRVVASLRKVGDRTASRFFATFYAELLAGTNPVAAVRAAQLRFLASRDRPDRAPAAWGAFEVLAAGFTNH